MNQKIINKAIQTSINLKHLPSNKNKHFSFIVRKNKIESIGWNDYQKTHPLSYKYNYYSRAIHSELACLLNCSKIDRKSYMINIRLGKNNKLLMSRPCDICESLLFHHGIFNVVYSTEEGFIWTEMKKITQ